MADFYWKRHDTSPPIIASLTDGQGNLPAGSLIGATVKFIMKAAGAGSTKINASATVIDAGSWQVGYTPIAADTSTSGEFQGEFEVTFSDATKQTFPDPGYIDIEITDDLDNA